MFILRYSIFWLLTMDSNSDDAVSVQRSWDVPPSLVNMRDTHAKEGNMFFFSVRRGDLMEEYGSSMEIHLLAGYI